MPAIQLFLVEAVDVDGRPSPIRDRRLIRLAPRIHTAKTVECDRCSRRVSELLRYRTGNGRVCRSCLAHVPMFELELDAAPRARRSVAQLAPKVRNVFDPLADRNLSNAEHPRRPLPVLAADAATPAGWTRVDMAPTPAALLAIAS